MDLELFEDGSSSSDDEEMEFLRRENPIIRTIPTRIQNFLEVTVNNCSDKEFQQHFRMKRQVYTQLLVKLTPILQRDEGGSGRSQIPIDRQILTVLWLLATPDSYRSVGCRFNMGKSSIFVSFYRVIRALNEIAPQIIKWPTREDRQRNKISFREIAGLTGVIGAIDGTYVPIKAPQENPEAYINRKCFYGITLQAICTPELVFTDCFTGYPSSVSDIRIFRNSDIYEKFLNQTENYFDEDEYIIGDKAYPNLKWCISPYINRGRLTERQTRFNTLHSKTRQVIERAFALLFGRFRRLKYLDMNRVDLIPATIIAACTLHNICLMEPDDLIDEYVNEGLPAVNHGDDEYIRRLDGGVQDGQDRRNHLADIL